ncbi:hypothetical protein ACFC0C_28125 [Streptomyces sp. NPDC056178]|uniref:hypothetical protein n=1 Tax=unclassified Streptomyces TaxID=2593676 RepID=UPI0035DAC3A8
MIDGARVRPAGELGGLGRARLRQGGELKDPGGAFRQRHQQLPGRTEEFGVEGPVRRSMTPRARLRW